MYQIDHKLLFRPLILIFLIVFLSDPAQAQQPKNSPSVENLEDLLGALPGCLMISMGYQIYVE